MSLVQRDSVAGRAYLDVQNLARRTRRPTAELLHAYALEGFLVRLTCSPEAGDSGRADVSSHVDDSLDEGFGR